MREYLCYAGAPLRVVGLVKAPCDMDACRLVLAMWGGETIIKRVESAPLADYYQAVCLERDTRERALYDEIMWGVNHSKETQ